MSFGTNNGREVLGWNAGCNNFGGNLEITSDQLIVDRILGTAMGCGPDLLAQDRWLARFFDSGPAWTLTESELTLTSAETAIVLAPRP